MNLIQFRYFSQKKQIFNVKRFCKSSTYARERFTKSFYVF